MKWDLSEIKEIKIKKARNKKINITEEELNEELKKRGLI